MPDLYQIVDQNPNDEQGGGCLCHPTRRSEDSHGPYMHFYNVDAVETGAQVPLQAVVCANCVNQACDRIGGRNTGAVSEEDIRDKITAQSQETVLWEDVPVETRAALKGAFPAGGRVKFAGGVTTVPPAGEGPTNFRDRKVIEASTAIARPEDELLAEDLALLPQEEPGDKPGEYKPVDEEASLR